MEHCTTHHLEEILTKKTPRSVQKICSEIEKVSQYSSERIQKMNTHIVHVISTLLPSDCRISYVGEGIAGSAVVGQSGSMTVNLASVLTYDDDVIHIDLLQDVVLHEKRHMEQAHDVPIDILEADAMAQQQSIAHVSRTYARTYARVFAQNTKAEVAHCAKTGDMTKIVTTSKTGMLG
jgi:hypothetical protein